MNNLDHLDSERFFMRIMISLTAAIIIFVLVNI